MTLAKLAVSLLMAVSIAGCSTSGPVVVGTLDKIKSSSTFNIGYIASVPPFSFPGPDRRPVGYSIDLCTYVASSIQRQLGISLKLNWVPVTRDKPHRSGSRGQCGYGMQFDHRQPVAPGEGRL